jgi:hypothetical protein
MEACIQIKARHQVMYFLTQILVMTEPNLHHWLGMEEKQKRMELSVCSPAKLSEKS